MSKDTYTTYLVENKNIKGSTLKHLLKLLIWKSFKMTALKE